MANTDDDRGILVGSAYMLALTAALFWLPVIGPLAAGYVGGRKAGSAGAGLVAAILPAIVAGVLVGALLSALPAIADWLAVLFTAAFTLWLIVQSGLVIVAGAFGGWTYERGIARPTPTV